MDDRRADEVDDLTLLVRRVRDREPAAETELVERFRRGLTLVLRRRCGDPALAEDLAQDALLLTLEKIRRGEIEQPERLAGFIHGSARNLLLAHRRKHARLVPMARPVTQGGPAEESRAAEDAYAQVEPQQLDELLRAEEAKLVRRLLAEMEVERDRELLIRFYLGRQPKESICAELGIDQDHFRRVLYRARERLKQLWLRFQKREQLFGTA